MPLQVGDSAPLFQDPDILTGQTFTLAEQKGKCVLVAFHGFTWCGPCQFAVPILQELWDEEFSNDPMVQFVVISVNESPTPELLLSYGITIPWLVDPAIPFAYQTENNVPHYFFLDDKLTIYKIQSGLFSNDAAQQKQAVRDAVKQCSEQAHPSGGILHLPPSADPSRLLAIQTILFGVVEGGGGAVIQGGKIIRIPPTPEPLRHLSSAKRDILLALSIHELARFIADVKGRKELEAAATAAIVRGAQGLGGSADKKQN